MKNKIEKPPHRETSPGVVYSTVQAVHSPLFLIRSAFPNRPRFLARVGVDRWRFLRYCFLCCRWAWSQILHAEFPVVANKAEAQFPAGIFIISGTSRLCTLGIPGIFLGLILEYLLLLWSSLRISGCLIPRLIGNKKYILGLILRILGHPTTTFVLTLDTVSRRLKTTIIKIFRLRASGHCEP